jgi:hypothetical protein
MNLKFFNHISVLVLLLSVVSCRQSKYVGDGYYLLKENTVVFEAEEEDKDDWIADHDILNEGEIAGLIRPEPNSKLKLFIYNRIDSTRYQKQVVRKREKFKRKNDKRKIKQDKKNDKRIANAKKKGKTHYKQKIKRPKTVRKGWRNWVVTHWGEAPVLLDTAKVTKTKQQMKIYLSQRGYKNGEVTDTIVYKEKKKKAFVEYRISSGEPYRINSITFHKTARNAGLIRLYEKMVRKEGTSIEVGNLLDEDVLEKEREHYTKFLKNNAFVGFTKNYINFIVDTTKAKFKADIVIFIKDKIIENPNNPDTTMVINHFPYKVNDVTYKLHNTDSLSFKDFEGFKKRCDSLGLPYMEKGNYTLLDTIFVQDTIIKTSYFNPNEDFRNKHGVKLFEKFVDTTIYYKGYFIYNEIPYVTPDLLDKQNFLEHTEKDYPHYAKDYYVDRTFKSFLRLDIFSRITPRMEVTPSRPLGNTVDVTYDFSPAKKQQFVLEPRATNTSSIMGVSGMISYANKNLFRSANQLKFSMEGGFQSQPLVVGDDGDENKTFEFRGLNTFEWGPTLTYRIPKFFPMPRKLQEGMSKRAMPSTDIAAQYNYQRRQEFKRHVAELSYKWKFSSANLDQVFTITPVRFNYVLIDKKQWFEDDLIATNDPFLINSYSDFFSLGIFNIGHHYSTLSIPKRKRRIKFLNHNVDNVIDVNAAGLVMNTIHALADKTQSFSATFNEDNKELFSVPYAQYARIENTFIFNQFINKKHRMVYRFIGGAGFVYGNSISLPYTQSFVAGGSNDIRAFDARTMAPGGIKTYLDSNATDTQIGDMKLELNLEWRIKFSSIIHGAIFVDMGNIWKLNDDRATMADDLGGFRFNDFYKYTAIGTGFGIRADFTYLIVRLDFSWSLHNPYLPQGERWWTSGKADYKNYFKTDPADPNKIVNYIYPHPLNFNFGIGYPF